MIFSIMTINSCDKLSADSNILADAYDFYNEFYVSSEEKLNTEKLGTSLKELSANLEEQLNDEGKLNKKYPPSLALSEDSLKQILSLTSEIGVYKLSFFNVEDRDNYIGIKPEDIENMHIGSRSDRPMQYKNTDLEYLLNSMDSFQISIEDIGFNPAWKVALDWDLLKSGKKQKVSFTKSSIHQPAEFITESRSHCKETPEKKFKIDCPYDWYYSITDCKGKDYPVNKRDIAQQSFYQCLVKNRLILTIRTGTVADDKVATEIIQKAFNWEYIKTL